MEIGYSYSNWGNFNNPHASLNTLVSRELRETGPVSNYFSQTSQNSSSQDHLNIVKMLPPMDYMELPVVTTTAASVTTEVGFSGVELVWIVVFSVMLSIAVSGNILVIWIISCHRRMRSVTNYFLLNLAIADLTMAALNGAPNFVYMIRNDWIFGKMFCVVNNFMANWTVASCVFTMTAISVDRWIAIVRPLEPRMSKTTAWLSILGIWLGSAVVAGPALVFSRIIHDDHNSRTHCMIIWPDGQDPTNSKFELGYNLCLFVLTYLIPMTAMAICYGSMSWELWFTQVGEITQRQINSMISKRKVVRMFIVVVTTFAVCWLPYHGYFLYMHLDKDIVYKKWIQHLYLSFYFLAMSQSSINPVIVISMNSRFRNYIWDLILNLKTLRCCPNQEERRPVQYVPATATPPLLRRYSRSCSRSRSRSGAEDGSVAGPNNLQNGNGRLHPIQNYQNFQPYQSNYTNYPSRPRKNMYVSNTNGHEVINLSQNPVATISTSTMANEMTRVNGRSHSPRAVRATYC